MEDAGIPLPAVYLGHERAAMHGWSDERRTGIAGSLLILVAVLTAVGMGVVATIGDRVLR